MWSFKPNYSTKLICKRELFHCPRTEFCSRKSLRIKLKIRSLHWLFPTFRLQHSREIGIEFIFKVILHELVKLRDAFRSIWAGYYISNVLNIPLYFSNMPPIKNHSTIRYTIHFLVWESRQGQDTEVSKVWLKWKYSLILIKWKLY